MLRYMEHIFFSELSHQMLFKIFDSKKQQKTNSFRIHHHTELELGYIVEGEGIYYLENEQYNVHAGDLYLIRTGEQHCIPTIHSPELISFNIHIEPYFIWDICSEFIENSYLRLLFDPKAGIRHYYGDKCGPMEELRRLAEDPEANRFRIRRGLLDLLADLLRVNELPEVSDETRGKNVVSAKADDIQNAICYINDHLTEPLNLNDLAHAANMSRSHLSAHFKLITGISPYEYLIIRRIELAVRLLRDMSLSVTEAARKSGFTNLANFNKTFKRITGMTPREYRQSKK